jgi:Fe-S cluster assembly ATPase SufC
MAMLIGVITDYRHAFPGAIFIIITHHRALFEPLAADVQLVMHAGRFV